MAKPSRRPTLPPKGPKKSAVKKVGKGPKTPKAKSRWSSEEKRVRNSIAQSTGKKRFSRRDFEDSLPSDRHESHPDERRGGRSTFETPRFERSDRAKRFDRREDRPRFDRDERPARSSGRDDRPRTNRDDRPARSYSRDDRQDRPRTNREERPVRSNDFARDDRTADRPRFNRDDRPARSSNRDDRSDRPRVDRDDRPARSFSRDDRSDRPRVDRDDRPARSFSRDDRSDRPRVDRDDRPARSFSRDDRSDRPRVDRDDRPARSFSRDDRSDRPRVDRDDRPARSFSRDDRSDRPRVNRDDRPARSFSRDDRSDRPRVNRDDRPARSFSRDDRSDRPRFNRDDRSDRPRFNRDDRGSRPMSSFAGRRPERGGADENPDTMEWSQAEFVEGSADTEFAQMGLPPKLVAALSGQGITAPFAIQRVTLPDALAGKDVLGRAETGSGKTLAFGIPLLSRLAVSAPSKHPRAVILVPTRELAVQVADALSPLAGGLGLRVVLVAGGMSYAPQTKAFERGVDIVVATPGRLIDLMEQYAVNLGHVEVTVLDEADHMADLGFLPAVTQIVDATPADGQRLLFSATLDNAVAKLVKKYMHDPVVHEIDSGQASVQTMTHHVLHVQGHDKTAIAAHLVNRPGRTLVFVRTQLGADRIARNLQEVGVLAAPLHGGLTQGARVRTLNAFKEGTIPVLVATDVAARGIHVDDVSLVLQLDPAAGPKDYLHRAGRTARAGHEGTVVSIAQPNQRRTLDRLLHDAGVDIQPRRVTATDGFLSEISGGLPAQGEALSPEEVAELLAPPKQFRKPFGKGGHRGGGYHGGGKKPYQRRR